MKGDYDTVIITNSTRRVRFSRFLKVHNIPISGEAAKTDNDTSSDDDDTSSNDTSSNDTPSDNTSSDDTSSNDIPQTHSPIHLAQKN